MAPARRPMGRDRLAQTSCATATSRASSRLPVPRLPGRHQAMNAALAVAMLRHQQVLDVPPSALNAAMGWADWPARLQKLEAGPLLAPLPAGSEFWVDGGHNPAAARQVAAYVRKAFTGAAPLHILFACLTSKDAAARPRPVRGTGRDHPHPADHRPRQPRPARPRRDGRGARASRRRSRRPRRRPRAHRGVSDGARANPVLRLALPRRRSPRRQRSGAGLSGFRLRCRPLRPHVALALNPAPSGTRPSRIHSRMTEAHGDQRRSARQQEDRRHSRSGRSAPRWRRGQRTDQTMSATTAAHIGPR